MGHEHRRTKPVISGCIPFTLLCLLAVEAVVVWRLLVPGSPGPPAPQWVGSWSLGAAQPEAMRQLLLSHDTTAPVSPGCQKAYKKNPGVYPSPSSETGNPPPLALPPPPPDASGLTAKASYADPEVSANAYGNYESEWPRVLSVKTTQGVFHRTLFASVRTPPLGTMTYPQKWYQLLS
jgi:hypothetical protein